MLKKDSDHLEKKGVKKDSDHLEEKGVKKDSDHLEEKGVKNGQRSPRAEMCRVIAMGRDVETGSGCFGGGGRYFQKDNGRLQQRC